jgi:hypothetical protein
MYWLITPCEQNSEIVRTTVHIFLANIAETQLNIIRTRKIKNIMLKKKKIPETEKKNIKSYLRPKKEKTQQIESTETTYD